MDTRPEYGFGGAFGPPSMGGSQSSTRDLPIPQGPCGIPSGAKAYSLNITVVPLAGRLQYLTVWPTGGSAPNVSTLNSFNGQTVANAAVVAAGIGGSVSVLVTDPAQVIIDINGYYTDLSGSGGIAGPTG